MDTKNFLQELEQLEDYWSPRVVGRVNDQFIKVAKLKGSLAWHKHDEEDELFYLLRGQLTIEYENDRVELEAGDFHVVPRGAMHNPIAEAECWIVLIETVSTKHTGDVMTARTRSIEEQLDQA